MIGQGDYFQAQVNYAEGATGYVAATNVCVRGLWCLVHGQYTLATAYRPTASMAAQRRRFELTTAWGVDASYEHRWNKQWKTSVYGSYVSFSYNDKANALACAESWIRANAAIWRSVRQRLQLLGHRFAHPVQSRRNTYLSLDIVYTNLNTASSGA